MQLVRSPRWERCAAEMLSEDVEGTPGAEGSLSALGFRAFGEGQPPVAVLVSNNVRECPSSFRSNRIVSNGS